MLVAVKGAVTVWKDLLILNRLLIPVIFQIIEPVRFELMVSVIPHWRQQWLCE